jgi:hypothetical protein
MYLHEFVSRQPVYAGLRLAEPPSVQTCSQTLDATAKAIVKDAQDPAYGKHSRAVQAVWNILKTYYPADASLVSSVIFLSTEPGLLTTSITSAGPPPNIRGMITVGPNFIDNTTERFFARRVLQVGHELQHIKQWRSGIVGGAFKNEREFLAHCWTAFAQEFPGTGCMYHKTRVSIIDCALGNYYCMSTANQAKYAPLVKNLLALRLTEEAASGNPASSPRATCDTSGC